MKKETQISTTVSQEALALLKDSYPLEQGYNKISLPRLSFVATDKTEGKGKTLKVVVEAGSFIKEVDTKTKDDEGKAIWKKEDLGKEIELTIIYSRKQLSLYDKANQSYTNSTVYDNDSEVVPLFSDRKQIDKGTPAELKTKYQYTDESGKVKSRLLDYKILYVLYEGEVYQLSLHGTSMYSFLTWAKKNLPPAVLVRITSEEKVNGDTAWNQCVFDVVRDLDADEVANVQTLINDIKFAINAEKVQYATNA